MELNNKELQFYEELETQLQKAGVYYNLTYNFLSDGTIDFSLDSLGQIGRVKIRGRKTKMQIIHPAENDNVNVLWIDNAPLDDMIDRLYEWVNYAKYLEKQKYAEYTDVSKATGPDSLQKNKKLVIGCIIGAVVLMIMFWSCVLGNSDNNTDETNRREQKETASITTVSESVVQMEGFCFDTGNHGVKYVSSEIKFENSQPVLIVNYEFANNDDYSASWSWDISHTIYQNGKECANALFYEDENTKEQKDKAEKGEIIPVTEAYYLNNATDDITIEMTEYLKDEVFFLTIVNLEEIWESSCDIYLVAGEKGEYGKSITMNKDTEFEESFFAYYVPYGTYKVTNIDEYRTQVNVFSDKTVINEDGWEEIADSVCNDVLESGASMTIVVPENYHIDIPEPSYIILEKISDDTTIETTVKETTTTAATTADTSPVVFITPTGEKYHYDSTCNGGTYKSSTLNKAKRMGLEPCNKCVLG